MPKVQTNRALISISSNLHHKSIDESLVNQRIDASGSSDHHQRKTITINSVIYDFIGEYSRVMANKWRNFTYLQLFLIFLLF